MTTETGRTIVVTGATGLQGSAVTRHLLSNQWKVRAVTRNPNSKKARALSAMGAEVMQGEMAEPESLNPVFAGAYGVFSVQNPVLSGIAGEIRQGKNVADAARQAGVQHLVYSSAGTGDRGTGVPSWETKLVIEDYIKSLGLPYTILRPMAFMELMTDKKFFPSVSTWHIMPKQMGSKREVVWICTDDYAYIIARVFAEPEGYLGKTLSIASDIQSIDACRAIYQSVKGKAPSRFPMPLWMFERLGFIGKDLTTMWRWLRDATFPMDTGITRQIHPQAHSVRSWLEQQRL